jgi:phospholipid/cholesterol/gamma-HCH transport system ATP-binding protein
MNQAIPKIALKGLKKRFGPKVVLDGIDLEVATGESLVVIGGSGTGKSVLLKCVIGIMEPDAGTVLIDGEETTHLSPSERTRVMRKFGMLFQGSALFDSLKVWETSPSGSFRAEACRVQKPRRSR